VQQIGYSRCQRRTEDLKIMANLAPDVVVPVTGVNLELLLE
jgi:hypothetical protein